MGSPKLYVTLDPGDLLASFGPHTGTYSYTQIRVNLKNRYENIGWCSWEGGMQLSGVGGGTSGLGDLDTKLTTSS